MLLKEEEAEVEEEVEGKEEKETKTIKWTVEWIVIDPAGWTGEDPKLYLHSNTK